MSTTWTDEKIAKLQHYLDQGLSLSSIGIRLQCSTSTLRDRINELERDGKRVPRIKKKVAHWTPEMQDKLVKAIKDNPDLTRSEIADLIGVSKNAVAGQVHRLQEKGILKRSKQAEFRKKHTLRAKRAREARTVEVPATVSELKLRPKTPPVYNPNRAASSNAGLQKNVSAGGDRLYRTAQEMAVIRKGKAERRAGLKTSGIADKVRELRTNQCRYIYGNTALPDCYYCEENKLLGYSYCPEHKKLCTSTAPLRSPILPRPQPTRRR